MYQKDQESKKKSSEKKGQRINIRQKFTIQKYPAPRRYSINFENKPLSNIDLMNWVKKLKIKYFRGVYSIDNLPIIMKKEGGIINLNNQFQKGSHWICYRNIDDEYCEYFDSFGLIMPKLIEKYLSTSQKQIIYSGDEIQERTSVLCGYWCLYYLIERQIGRSVFDTIHNKLFDINNQNVNHHFIINYFENI